MKVRCPGCRNFVEWTENPFRPFCSERCKDGDLGRWAAEEYRIAKEEADSGEGKPRPRDDEDDS